MAYIRFFLVALFKNAADVLARESMGSTNTDRITNFRAFMSKAQSMQSAGEGRRQFYDKVISDAGAVRLRFLVLFVLTNLSVLKAMTRSTTDKEGRPVFDYPSDNDLQIALAALRTVLNKDSDEKKHCIVTEYGVGVDVFIMFDEAHTLTDCYDDHKESRFVVLRRTLSVLHSDPLFSFFLSTTGKVTQFGQPRGHDNSDRINEGCLETPCPYIFVGFDQLVQSRKVR